MVLDFPAHLQVLRAGRAEGPYDVVGQRLEASAGRTDFTFRDAAVAPSGEYCYKIACEEAGVWSYSSPVRAVIPGGAAASLTIRSNPAPKEILAELVLPTAGPARLEVLDVRGRRVLLLDLSGLGPGHHVLNLGVAPKLAAGVYVVRLSSGREVRAAKAVLMR